ncbi:partial Chromosome-partitioning protein Spo0J, partial [Gammaproteobacteria bacterium]
MSKPNLATTSAYDDATGFLSGGIDSLFSLGNNEYALIDLDQIEVKEQIRESFEDEHNTLDDLADSIKARGILQPVLVRPSAHAGYELIAGERRYRAAILAGMTQIPAVIKEMTDEEAEDAQLAENIHRKNLTQIEEAKKIQKDLDRLGSTEAVLAKHHKSKAWLSKTLSLLSLPGQAKRLVTEDISADIEVINAVKGIEKIDPEAAKDIDALKGITALKAQMNTDLLTEDLKKARSSNQSFWLMGQP